MKRTFILSMLLGFALSAHAEVHESDPFKAAPEHDVLLMSGGESCYQEVCPKGEWVDHLDYYVFDHQGIRTVSLYQYQNWSGRDLIDMQVHELGGEQDAKGRFEFKMNRGDNFMFVLESTDMDGTVTVENKTIRAPQ